MRGRPDRIPIYRYNPNHVYNPETDELYQQYPVERQISNHQYYRPEVQVPIQEPYNPPQNQPAIPLHSLENQYSYPPQDQPVYPTQDTQPQQTYAPQQYPYPANLPTTPVPDPSARNQYSYDNDHLRRNDVVIMERGPIRNRHSSTKKSDCYGEFFSGLVLGLIFNFYSFVCIICWPRKSFIMGTVAGTLIGFVIGVILGLSLS